MYVLQREKNTEPDLSLLILCVCILKFVYSSGCLYNYSYLLMQSQLFILIPAL